MTNSYEDTHEPLESEDPNIVRKELKKLIEFYYSTLEGYDLIYDTAMGFKREHPDAYDYILFHDLIASTPPPWATKFDMPNHEIEHLIEDLPKILNEKRKAA